MVCTAAEEDGGSGLRAVLMDFGLARDALGPQRLTQTGVIMGTPHYMAPEQARGRARHLDRRADVYSLGAVLHELVVGKPPFDADNEVELLLAVLNQEPPPLRQVEPSVPPDLEVIVLKCLQKEPAQRYESALALAEDLGRYLRGEPIVARPASTLYRLRRLAQRHRARVALGAICVISLLALGLLFVQAQREQVAAEESAKAREQMAAQLGKTVTEMKLFLRVAYSLPPHDLRREQQVIRSRILELEQQLPRADQNAKGALEWAIGQGYLVLGESETAVRHLEQALQSRYEKRAVHLALGQALGRVFEEKRDTLRRSTPQDQLNTQVEALRRQYVVRARQELVRGQEAELGSADYVDALLHFYESDSPAELAKALAGARKAQAATPWLLEPFDLEVKIRVEQINNQLTLGKYDNKQEVAEAIDTLARAIDMARSYPNFYLSNNQFSLIMLKLALFSGKSPQEVESIYTSGLDRAQVALTLLPTSGDAHDQLARLYAQWSYFKSERNQDPGDALQQALKVVTQSDTLLPERAEHYFVRGRILDQVAMRKWLAGEPAKPDQKRGIADIKKAAMIDPGNVDYLNTAAVLISFLGKWTQESGDNALPLWEEAIALEERAAALRPQNAVVRSNLLSIRVERAEDYIERGIDATEELSRARSVLQAVMAINPKLPLALENKFQLQYTELHHQLAKGQDIAKAAAELAAVYRQMAQEAPPLRSPWDYLSNANFLHGEALLHNGESPEPVIAAGLADLQAGIRAAALPLGMQVDIRSRLLLMNARWLLRTGKSPLPILAAITALPQVTMGPQAAGKLASIALTRASIHRLAADWQSRHGQPPAVTLATIDSGLAALADHLRLLDGAPARARAERGALLAIKARTLREPAAQNQVAQEAAALLQTALRDSPPLSWDYRSYLDSASPQQ